MSKSHKHEDFFTWLIVLIEFNHSAQNEHYESDKCSTSKNYPSL